MRTITIHRCYKGSMNPAWKGVNAAVSSKHYRLYRKFGKPMRCEVCGTTDKSKTYDWANLTGDYDDLNDFKRMCRSCHWRYDKKENNFKGYKKQKMIPDSLVIEMNNLYRDGMSMLLLSKKYKRTQQSIWQLFKTRQLPCNKKALESSKVETWEA